MSDDICDKFSSVRVVRADSGGMGVIQSFGPYDSSEDNICLSKHWRYSMSRQEAVNMYGLCMGNCENCN